MKKEVLVAQLIGAQEHFTSKLLNKNKKEELIKLAVQCNKVTL
jgi:hypothetical protein